MLIPLVGMILFIILYTISAIYYPGGSWNYMNHEGFSFWHNYLCDLLDNYAVNGELNNGRFFARAALGILCAAIMLIWYFLPGLFSIKSIRLHIMKWCGILSLVITLFLASGTHDLIIRIAGVFGIVAVMICLIELFKMKYNKLFALGVFCLMIFIANYVIYETRYVVITLPVIQKVTFISFMLWFLLLDIELYKKLRKYTQNNRPD